MSDPETTLRLEVPAYESMRDFAKRHPRYEQFRKDRRAMRNLVHIGGLVAVNLLTAAVVLTIAAAVFNQTPWGLIGGFL